MSEATCNQHRWVIDTEADEPTAYRSWSCATCRIPAPIGLHLYSEDAGVTWTETRPADWPDAPWRSPSSKAPAV